MMPPVLSMRSPGVVGLTVLAAVLLVPGSGLDASPSPGDGPEPPARYPAAVPDKPGTTRVPFARPAVARSGSAASGTLTGKTVYVSAGHGWTYTAGAWHTQRGNTHDLVEDFITAEGVDQDLIPLLQAMGAYVVPIRESDLGSQLVVVDDGEAAIEGMIAEGAGATGWGALPVPFTGGENPFALGRSRTMTAASTETGRVVYAAAAPASGYYNVYISYVQGVDRVSDAHVVVRHAGGESHLRVDQRRHGSTWMLLGRWYFEAGAPAERSSIAFANDSAEPGGVISFDAVRLGGGMAPHERGGATTGRPAYESAARYSTQLLGAPPSVWDFFMSDDASNDVVSRPRFAAWDHEAGEDAVYLAWHTNAPSPSRGTLSIAYGNTFPCCSPLGDFAGTAGSLELLSAVHDEILADLRADWDPTWRDAGKVTASLGELRPSNNDEMPAILVELAFHDTTEDADALRDPRFRMLAARAMAQGIARYFATKDGRALVLPPEPPSAVRVENIGGGALRVSWRAPVADPAGGDAPTGYRVEVGDNGYGFDDGIAVTGESVVLGDLPRGALRFVRVTATNAGGDSLPSEVVGARLAARGKAPILVVGGVDRLDKLQDVRDAAPLLGTLDRVWLDRMNDGTYAARHGTALAAAGFAFDGASDEAVEQGDLDLTSYRGIDWFVGEDGVAQDPLSAASRAELVRFFGAGGSLLLSGAEVIRVLDTQGTQELPTFLTSVLHTTLAADDAETYDVTPVAGPFAALGPISFRDDGPFGYDAESPDVLAPTADATTALAYATGGAAAIAWQDGVGGSRGIIMGFPIETIADGETRRELLAAAFASFGIDPEPASPESTGCGCGSGSAAGDGGGASLLVLGVAGLLWRTRSRSARPRRAGRRSHSR
jgi:N-acetylmuramoyl-L-alanine amidase